MLIRRCSIINEMGDELAEEMTDLVELSLVWFAVIFFFQEEISFLFFFSFSKFLNFFVERSFFLLK